MAAWFLASAAAMACVDHQSIHVSRRACAFGSYQMFQANVDAAMVQLGCNPECKSCSFATADDCTRFAVLAAYSEEAGDPAMERLSTALAPCILPGGASVPAADIIRQIKNEPEMPCSNSSDVSGDAMAGAVTLIGFSLFLLINTVLSIDTPR